MPDTAAVSDDHPHRARERVALWAALLLIVAWGANFSVQKAVFEVLSPGGFLFVRYLIMPLAAALLLCAHHGTRWPRLPRGELLALLKLGIAGHLLHVGLVTHGIHWSTAFSSSLILACGPVFTLLILRWHGIEKLSRAQVAGVVVAVLGVGVFLSDKFGGGHWRAGGGDLVLLVAASFFSYYTVAAKPLIERHGGMLVMTYGTLLGSLAGGRAGRLGRDRRALHRRQTRRRGDHAGRRGAGAVRVDDLARRRARFGAADRVAIIGLLQVRPAGPRSGVEREAGAMVRTTSRPALPPHR